MFGQPQTPLNYYSDRKHVMFIFRDGTLEKLWGGEGEGNFRAAGIFFRYQIPCMNCMNIFWD